jgi:hypothetical protein
MSLHRIAPALTFAIAGTLGHNPLWRPSLAPWLAAHRAR